VIAVSFVISTHNRRDVLLSTLHHVVRCGLPSDSFETILIDNASQDGSGDAIRERFPEVQIVTLSENRGSCAKNTGIAMSRGHYVVFLDDDSYPRPGAIARMIRHFENNSTLGAATFTVTLPNGSRECSAYPDVFIGCGVGIRRRALLQVGGLPEDFFMQAEEYDLSLRLLDAGWSVKTFDDLHVVHLKSPRMRRSRRTMRLDVRNNILVALRRFPTRQKLPFLADWLRRYWAIAQANDQRLPFVAGLIQGFSRVNQTAPISDEAFEQFSRIAQIEQLLRRERDRYGLARVLFLDWGKNILPYWLAAQKLGLAVVAIADTRLNQPGTAYRGIPIISDDAALKLDFDAAIVTNSSREHAALRRDQWRWRDDRPVIELLEDDARLTVAVRAEAEYPRTAARSA
jgi:GT2 family glycosyltransferase